MKMRFFTLLFPMFLMGCQNASQLSLNGENKTNSDVSEIITKDTIYLPIKLKHSDYQDDTKTDDDTGLDSLLRNADMTPSNQINLSNQNTHTKDLLSPIQQQKENMTTNKDKPLKLDIKPAPLEKIQSEVLYEQKILDRPKENINKIIKPQEKPVDLSLLSAPIHKPLEKTNIIKNTKTVNKRIENHKKKEESEIKVVN